MPTEPRGEAARTSWTTSSDGTRLRLTHWGAGDRALLVVPGLAEHAGRYAHVGEALAGRGWAVTVLEMRGHGHSGGKRGHVMDWSEYRADVRAAAATLPATFSMIGHSMGGLVSLDTVRDGLAPVRLALSNPLLGVRLQAPALKKAAARLLSRVWPSLSLFNEIPAGGLSRDEAVGVAYKNDPLVYDTITPRWYTEMLAAMQRVHGATFDGTRLGVFLGDADPITDPAINQAFSERARTHLKVYRDFRHEIFNEIGKEQVILDVGDWLDA